MADYNDERTAAGIGKRQTLGRGRNIDYKNGYLIFFNYRSLVASSGFLRYFIEIPGIQSSLKNFFATNSLLRQG